MADGSELNIPYRYGWKDLVFGSGTDFVTTEVTGLLGMVATAHDTDALGDHGAFPGAVLMGKRVIEFDMTITGQAGEDIEDKLAIARRVFQVPRKRYARVLEPFTFWRPGQPKKMCLARCTRRDFTSDFKTARGLAEGSVQLEAPDTLIYSTDAYSTDIQPVGGTGSAVISMDGDYVDGAWPMLTITGPVTTAIITNDDDDGRAIRLDLNLASTDTATLDVAREILWVNGVRASNLIRSDNQWWALLPGDNNVTYTRQGGSDVSQVTVTHRNVWQ